MLINLAVTEMSTQAYTGSISVLHFQPPQGCSELAIRACRARAASEQYMNWEEFAGHI